MLGQQRGVFPDRKSIPKAHPSPVPGRPGELQASAPLPTVGKASFLIPRASYSSETAESWEEIASPEGRASFVRLFFRAAFGANDLSFPE